jgi:LmbE family N-acetylglucosaminyl deacetylase
MSSVRHTICTMLDGGIRLRSKQFAVADWAASAVIVAPHPDDETLGCGGVAAKKIRAGADVRFIFVTDGAASHVGRVDQDTLRAMREKEAIEAVRRLGATADRATFLRIPDGAARHHVEAMASAIVPLLEAWKPQSVFVPHAKEPPSDHVAVHAGVQAALRGYGRRMAVFEYPVWYWYHWPWVRIVGDRSGTWRTAALQTIRTVAGLRAMTALNAYAYVGDVLDVKQNTLAAHESQTRRPYGQDDWPILADVSRGDFVARLLTDYEMFTRYEVNM